MLRVCASREPFVKGFSALDSVCMWMTLSLQAYALAVLFMFSTVFVWFHEIFSQMLLLFSGSLFALSFGFLDLIS
jgi:hypothetical protein